MKLTYNSLEKLSIRKPVDRLGFISESCTGRTVLDIGCFDETALVKRETEYWLHGRIAALAKHVDGIDNSSKIPTDGLRTGRNSMIYRGNGLAFDGDVEVKTTYDLIVAGEFIEHIENPLSFFRDLKAKFPGREVILSTPNGVAFSNTLMGSAGREVQHPDHLANFTFKVLNTLCARAGFEKWEIIPYRFYATEMILNSKGAKRALARTVQQFVRLVEKMFPLLSFGYIVKATI